MLSSSPVKVSRILLLLLVLTSSESQVPAQEVAFHGFVLVNFSGRTDAKSPGRERAGDFLLGEERLRLDLTAWAESVEASARIKADLLHDAVDGEFDLDLREAYLDYTAGDFDFRLGRQIITWGVGDLVFINDVFPKDWVSFFSGRSLEYLKLGVDGVRTRYSSPALNVEVVIIPFFEPDNLPTAQRFVLMDPFASVSLRQEDRPETTYANTEAALRVYRRIGDFDVSAYAYRGFWRLPGLRPDDFTEPDRVTVFYPRLAVYGLSAQGNQWGGVLSLETGYYDSRQDRNGEDPVIPNAQGRFLAGYQRQIRQNLTFGLQYYREVMQDYRAYQASLPHGLPASRRVRDMLTVRLEQLSEYQTWKVSLFTFYSPADRDWLLQPQLTYKFSDRLTGTLGANLFGGLEKTTALGQLKGNNNVFVAGRFDF